MKTKVMNKANPGVKVVLDKERVLKLDLNAMAAFEEATGKSLMDGSFQSSNMSIRDVRAMLWACLIHEDDALTEKQVGSWVDMTNMLEVASKLNEAFEVAIPEGKEGEPNPLVKAPLVG